jgi:hypothetical protein
MGQLPRRVLALLVVRRGFPRARAGGGPCPRMGNLGVQVDYNVVHLRTSLVQLLVLLLQNFEKVVQMIELKRFEGAPNGYPFAPLVFWERGSICGSTYSYPFPYSFLT